MLATAAFEGGLDEPSIRLAMLGCNRCHGSAGSVPDLLAVVRDPRQVRAVPLVTRGQSGALRHRSHPRVGPSDSSPSAATKRRRSERINPYSAARFQTRLAISVRCTALSPKYRNSAPSSTDQQRLQQCGPCPPPVLGPIGRGPRYTRRPHHGEKRAGHGAHASTTPPETPSPSRTRRCGAPVKRHRNVVEFRAGQHLTKL